MNISKTFGDSFSARRFASSIIVALLILQNVLIISAGKTMKTVRAGNSSALVISQIYAGGGASTGSPTYRNDYVELLNKSNAPVSLAGLALQYGTSTGNFGGAAASILAMPNVVLQPGQYYFVQLGLTGTAGNNFPVAPDIASGHLSMAADSGKVALTKVAAGLGCGSETSPCSLSDSRIVDLVSYGAANNAEGDSPLNGFAPLTNQQGGVRKSNGCEDTDQNNSDFNVVINPIPRNFFSPLNQCADPNERTNPYGIGSSAPGSPTIGNTATLTVVVTPGANPVSTGITVTGDLSSLGGSINQQFFDDGSSGGDAAAGDNIFSYAATIPFSTETGNRSLLISIADAEGRASNATISLTIRSTSNPLIHLAMGNPSQATTDANNPDNYLLLKDQYAVSYNRSRGIPNWVSWHLDSSWLGSAQRQDDFRPDTTLPAGWYQVTPSDYTNSGFDRGHNLPSADRTATEADNSATFLMTNIVPQAPDSNQGVWQDLEGYCRELAGQGKELYIVTGGAGTGGIGSNGSAATIAGGKVAVPAYTWKVILVLPSGGGDVSRVDAETRAFAVILPNVQGIRNDPWQKYLATVDQVENLTGYDFFSNVPALLQSQIESRLDSENSVAPQTIAGGVYTDLDVTAPNAALGGNVAITGKLNLGGSILNTGTYKITLAPNAVVSRLSGYVIGRVEKEFNDAAAPDFVYPIGTANGYSPVTADLTALGSIPSSLTASATQTAHPNVPYSLPAIKRFWTLEETGDLTVNLNFQYLEEDAAGIPYENALRLACYEGAFGEIPSNINTAANTATGFDINRSADLTLYVPGLPTAALVGVSGRVMTARRIGIANARVDLTNQNGETQTTRTNSLGYYRFENVGVGQTYVFNVSSKQRSFAPQIITITEETAALDFQSEK